MQSRRKNSNKLTANTECGRPAVSKSKKVLTGSLISIFALATIFAFSKTAHAGLFSLISSMLGEQASAKTETKAVSSNSQTIAVLQAAVNSDPNPDKPLDVIPVADDFLVADMASNGAPEITTQISTYTVRSGDSLSSIAKMFGVSVNTILWANNLSRTSKIQPGQSLVILPVSGITYTVKKGDTIKGIVNKYKADLDEVLSYNDLTVNSPIKAGQTIIMPDVELQAPVSSGVIVKNNPAHDTNGPDYAGYFLRPVAGGTRTQGLHGYNGIDIADRIGTPIYAAAEGKVMVSMANGAYNGGYGNFIIISHPNGAQTLYAHASKNLVTVGQYVAQGQTIALMGATGKATGSHLHFEIRGAKNPF